MREGIVVGRPTRGVRAEPVGRGDRHAEKTNVREAGSRVRPERGPSQTCTTAGPRRLREYFTTSVFVKHSTSCRVGTAKWAGLQRIKRFNKTSSNHHCLRTDSAGL
jgi:hypothetical protein